MPFPARTWMLATTIVFGILGLLSLLPALTSFFLFDAPGSEKILASSLSSSAP